MNLNGKRGVVTGGTSGIGLHTAQRALELGAAEVIVTGQNEDRLRAAEDSLAEYGKVAGISWRADVPGDTETLAKSVTERFGELDFLVANAGVCWESPLGKLDVDAIQKQLMINVTGPLLLINSLVPLMKPGSSIVLTTSCLNQLGIPGYAVYSASKAALRSLARTLSAELMDKQIRVNSIAPGPFETPIHTKYGLGEADLSAVKQHVASLVPMGRFGTTDEIVDAMAFLVSDSSRFMVGEEIAIDGGWSNL